MFDLQDKVAISVAGVIEPALQAAEMRRSAARPTTDLTAYDLYLRALAIFFPITKERIFEALGLLEQAIAIDPHYGPALSWAAICHMRLVSDGWAEEPETNRRKAVDLARQALQVGENDPGILANAALVLAQFGEDIGAMIGLVDRALALNPSFARGWYRERPSQALGRPTRSRDRACRDLAAPEPARAYRSPLSVIGMAYFFKHQFDEAASKLLLAIQDNPGFPTPYRTLAACYAHMGRLDEARAIVARLRAITPLVVPSDLPFRNPEDRELFLSGLRLAAGEADMSQTRRLAAILAADVAGYSRLMGADEEGTLERLKALRRELVDPKITEHHGRIVKTTGDGLLVEFASVVDAVRCAVEVQRAMPERNAGLAAGRPHRIPHRHQCRRRDGRGRRYLRRRGEYRGRLEAWPSRGGICVSARCRSRCATAALAFDDLGEQRSRTSPDRCGSTGFDAAGARGKSRRRIGTGAALPDKPSIAVLPFANMSGDPEQEYFADGMVEDIITALSRSAGSSSSPAIRASPTRAGPSM